MADSEKYIKKIRLTDGSVFYLYDVNAPRISDLSNYLPLTGGEITGNLKVDQKIMAGELQVESIEYQSTSADHVLIQASDGTIKKRSANELLSDIGGCSYSIDSAKGVLSFKIGKQ